MNEITTNKTTEVAIFIDGSPTWPEIVLVFGIVLVIVWCVSHI